MSGGHFNGCGYVYYQVNQFADELENEIENNERENEYGYAPLYRPDVIAYLKSVLPMIQKTAKIMKEIDYLYSGDHGEDSFMSIVQRLEKSTSENT